ncbi:MAG: AMP-binding protein [Candidatus Thorarchaeota archaeon]
MNRVVWTPSKKIIETTNIHRFMQKYQIASYDELIQRSVNDIKWFWNAVVDDIDVEWFTPYTKVLDDSKGIEWTRWFIDGRLNIVHNILDRHCLDHLPDRRALIWVSETGEERILTYRELNAQVCQLANALRERGYGIGDPMGIVMPMIPEAIMALLAIFKIGAIAVPIFSGFGFDAISMRLQDIGAKVLFTADASVRRGRIIPIKEITDKSVKTVSTLEHLIVAKRMGTDIPWTPGRDFSWAEFLANQKVTSPTEAMDSEAIAMVLYSSGTTGKPKGTVHTHAGTLVQAAKEVGYYIDIKPNDLLFWVTDLGWMMGPWQVIGAQHHGATHLIYEGAVDYPSPDQLWSIIEKHKVTIFGLSPTAVRYLMRKGDEWVGHHDLSSLRILGSTGEPWDDTSWMWFFEKIGQKRIPIINISGGTEIFGCFLSPLPITELKPRTLRGPGLGMAVDVIDDSGTSVHGKIGTLICRKPAPSMTRGFWNDPERYLETYWSVHPGVWWHGDLALRDDDGFWFLLGRADDVVKVAGKRVGPAEVETALISHPKVSEAASIGVPHEIKGTAIVVHVVLVPGSKITESLRDELKAYVGSTMGKPFIPHDVRFVSALPKTRSGKIVRHLVKKIYLGENPGDLSSIENPEAIDSIRNAQ